MRLEIGNRVDCTDGVYGKLADIVIDPLEKRVTHLVVQLQQGDGGKRLVPIQLAKGRDDEQKEIELGCTLDEAQRFESVKEFAYLRLGESPADDPDWDVGVEDVLAMPYYSGLADETGAYWGEPDSNMSIYYDRVPKGEVEIRRASAVISADGHSLGEVDGFLVDADEQITHFVLERGHLWGRKEVTIPIGAVARVESDAVHVALSKDEVGALPAVRVGRHG
ncbi:MAG TPA: PRC-barrel domain-containing protein [Gaiellaceae bacterium]|jgi:sporulation protein YlmC with PRC-barrel domain